MDIHTRIRERRTALELSQRELGAAVGVSHQTVAKWELADGKGIVPRPWRLHKVAETLRTTPAWLLTGNGDNVKQAEGKLSKNYVFIPRYYSRFDQGRERVQYHAEVANLDDADDTYAYRRDWLAARGLNPETLRVWLPKDGGMSMGDQLLLDLSKTDITAGLPYLIETPSGVMVRRLFLRTDGQVAVRADNPAFPEEVVPREALDIAGQIVSYQADVTI